MAVTRAPEAETALLIDNEEVSSHETQNSQNSSRRSSNQTQNDFAFIKIIARITLQLIRKFWALSSAGALAIILFYWLCGGWVAFALVAFALSGNFLLDYYVSFDLNFFVKSHRFD